MNSLDYQRLALLGEKVRNNTATDSETDEYMTLLYRNGSITHQQYMDFRSGRNSDAIVKAAVAVGAVLLIGYLLDQIFAKR
jgi:hypothetical protein